MKTYKEAKMEVEFFDVDIITGSDEDELPIFGGDFDDFWA